MVERKKGQPILELSWEDVNCMINKIEHDIKMVREDRKPLFVGVKRGGVIPAILLAYRFESKHGDIDDENENPFYNSDTDMEFSKDVILVDDITDYGTTLEILERKYEEYIEKTYMSYSEEYRAKYKAFTYEIVTLTCKYRSRVKPNYYGRVVADDVRVKFPWEIK